MRSVRQDLDGLPPLGNVPAALGAGRERAPRSHWRTTIALLGAAAAVVAVFGAVAWTQSVGRGDQAPPASGPANPPSSSDEAEPFDEPIDIGDEIRTIFPETTIVGTPAPSGALLARSCEATAECRWTFVSASNQTLPVADVSGALDRLLTDTTPGNVSISYDGRWMSIDAGPEVRVQSLDPERSGTDPLVLQPDAQDLEWDLVAWGGGSLSASFVEVDSEGIATRYARVDLLSGDAEMVPAPSSSELGPVGDGGVGPQVETRFDASPHEPVTKFRTAVVAIDDDASMQRGKVVFLSDTPSDLSSAMTSGETLVGPDGLMEIRTPPGADVVWPHVTVFVDGPNGVVRSGVIESRQEGPVRLDSPQREAWQVLGSDRAGSVIARSTEDGATAIVMAQKGDQILWERSLPGDVAWVVPGLALSQ